MRINIKRALCVASAASLLAASYATATILAPLPELHPDIHAAYTNSTRTANSDWIDQHLAAQTKPTAIGWDHTAEIHSNNDQVLAIASITKLVTALVGLERQSVLTAEHTGTYTITQSDVARTTEITHAGGSVQPMRAGATFTGRQMLEIILIPSANNYAEAYAKWVFGSQDAFIAATQEYLARHKLNSIKIYDSSGLDGRNSATASDTVALGKIALQNHTIAEIVRTQTLNVPGLPASPNTNPLLKNASAIGIKTGTTNLGPGGYNLLSATKFTTPLFAEPAASPQRDIIAIVAALRRDNQAARNSDSAALLKTATQAARQLPLIHHHSHVGTLKTWQGERLPVTAVQAITPLLLPGESVKINATTTTVQPQQLANSDTPTPVGTLTVQHSAGGTATTELQVTGQIKQPDWLWRITHPLATISWWFHSN